MFKVFWFITFYVILKRIWERRETGKGERRGERRRGEGKRGGEGREGERRGREKNHQAGISSTSKTNFE